MTHLSRRMRGSFRAPVPILMVFLVPAIAALAAACGGSPDAGGEARAGAAADSAVASDATGADRPDVGSPTGQAARDSVLAELRAYYRDFSARDWEAFRDHFWTDATITTIWRPEGEAKERVLVQTAAEFAEAGPQGPGSREIFEEEMTSHRADVDAAAGVATVWADYRARFGDPGEVMEWTGTDVFTLLRHDGRWRIASLVFVPEGGGGPGP